MSPPEFSRARVDAVLVWVPCQRLHRVPRISVIQDVEPPHLALLLSLLVSVLVLLLVLLLRVIFSGIMSHRVEFVSFKMENIELGAAAWATHPERPHTLSEDPIFTTGRGGTLSAPPQVSKM